MAAIPTCVYSLMLSESIRDRVDGINDKRGLHRQIKANMQRKLKQKKKGGKRKRKEEEEEEIK